ncbi:glycine cleavage system protein GcvH [Prosthecochloris sp. N3]|uniref:Glycine cleavage system H protein n=1 Tax=Prosthecochloris ethylica TaxID=2743976 RepID=A0ABR9XPZ8_9CHLB|nr:MULTISPECIES: glycine cleavage system protein GcvH [Prosthecochloris]MEC9487834.1 glycine cleavage system protein GcvH [Prosthecochloris sp.]MBF0586489.1 glycine cleavage system protein GcvH [Prosthecochloris ethylica]MBF0636102.1 glycine cleavage system protein GcvH [Prosthecochloris ethylica]NUK47761.1 glycine cleavage system protein GcvH [Prosthecochloris ethylica]RNA64420.1 glycine cleavage system protein GcvH [Prosthecochloris sp. ZM_2]
MNIPDQLRYTKDHEWVKVLEDGATALVGITDFAQSELGDIVFVETKPVGTALAAHDVFGTVEAVKTVADLFAPVDGEIVGVNDALDDAEVVNTSPYDDGWMVKMALKDASQIDGLMTAAEYREMIGE